MDTGPLFTKRTGVLQQDLVKSRSRKIGYIDARIALYFDWHLGSAAADMPVKLQSDWKSINSNRLQDFKRSCDKTSVCSVNRGPAVKCLYFLPLLLYDIINQTSQMELQHRIPGLSTDIRMVHIFVSHYPTFMGLEIGNAFVCRRCRAW